MISKLNNWFKISNLLKDVKINSKIQHSGLTFQHPDEDPEKATSVKELIRIKLATSKETFIKIAAIDTILVSRSFINGLFVNKEFIIWQNIIIPDINVTYNFHNNRIQLNKLCIKW